MYWTLDAHLIVVELHGAAGEVGSEARHHVVAGEVLVDPLLADDDSGLRTGKKREITSEGMHGQMEAYTNHIEAYTKFRKLTSKYTNNMEACTKVWKFPQIKCRFTQTIYANCLQKH